MGTALVGLAGVIVGALITGGVQWWAVVRKERLDARTAARVLTVSSEDVRNALEMALENGRFTPSGESDPLTSAATLWQQERSNLARVMGREDFTTVATAFRSLERVLWARSMDDADEAAIAEAARTLAGVTSELLRRAIELMEKAAA
jgi:hypothetical protein